jgi:hypothetical protein
MESLYPELSIGMCPFRIEECWTEICKQKQEIEDFQRNAFKYKFKM